MKKRLFFTLSLLSALTIVSCDTTIPAESISIFGSVTTLEVGKTITLGSIVTPNDSTDVINWSSSNEEVATVDNNGTVTALSVGDVIITATAGDASDSYDLTVVHNLDITSESLKGPLALEGTWIVDSTEYDIQIYVSNDRYYVNLSNGDSNIMENRYYAGEDGYLYSDYIYYDNTVASSGAYYDPYTTEFINFSDEFYNPFAKYDLTKSDYALNEDGTYTLTLPLEVGVNADTDIIGALTFTTYAVDISTLDITLNPDSTISKISLSGKDSNELTHTLNLEVTDPYSIGAFVVPYESTEESKILQNFFDKVNELNYTAKIIDSNDINAEYSMEVTEGKFYFKEGSDEYILLDTDTGVDMAKVSYSGNNVTLTGALETKYYYNTIVDYVPTLDFAAELFEVSEDGDYVLMNVDYLYSYAYYTLLDAWFFDYYDYVVEDTLKISLDEDGLGATITYEYSYVDTILVTGKVTTIISNVGETVDRFNLDSENVSYNPSPEYQIPEKWSDVFSSDELSEANVVLGNIDNYPFINFESYSSYSYLLCLPIPQSNRVILIACFTSTSERDIAQEDYAKSITDTTGWSLDEDAEQLLANMETYVKNSGETIWLWPTLYPNSGEYAAIYIYLFPGAVG